MTEAQVIPDFSGVGYRNAGAAGIPDANSIQSPHVQVVTTMTGDAIQTAVDTIESLPVQADGYRGVVKLQSGTYVADSAINIQVGGVIIQGAGKDSTTILATWTDRTGEANAVFDVRGGGPASGVGSPVALSAPASIGDKQLQLPASHGFSEGDTVFIITEPTTAWVADVGCDDEACWLQGGQPIAELNYRYKRTIIAVDGGTITLDCPIVDTIDNDMIIGSVQRYTWANKISHVGVEGLHIESVYANDTDENHAWTGVSFDYAEDGWVRGVDAEHMVYATVRCEYSHRVSVVDCRFLDPKGQIRGSRRYSFVTEGELTYFEGCFAEYARHSFSCNTGSRGPNVFKNCVAQNESTTSGPYHRWSTGILYDSCTFDGELFTEDRVPHTRRLRGWTGTTVVFYNCVANAILMETAGQSYPHYNWAIGCIDSDNVISTNGSPRGIVQSAGVHVSPASLYDQQVYQASPAGRYESWATESGLTVGSNDGMDVDVDDDGVAGLLEYALGGHPLAQDAQAILPQQEMVMSGGQRYFVFSYHRRRDHLQRGLNYRVQTSQDLVTGFDANSPGLEDHSTTTLNADFEEVECRVPMSGNPRMFLRLHVTLE